MKKNIASREFGNILFEVGHDVDDRTEYDDKGKPKDGYSTYLSLTWIDKYGDKVGHGSFSVDIPVDASRLREIGLWLLAQADRI